MRCMLVCSYTYTKKFSFSASRIKIREYRAEFTEDCNECGKCVEQCFYGALEMVK